MSMVSPLPGDSSDALQRIEKNTADLVWWLKVLVIAMIILILVNISFIV
jgi:hypothetical protein